MIYQILDGQTVTNTITADIAFMQAQYPLGNYLEVPGPPPVIAPAPRHVSVGAFYDRFGDQKYLILSSTNMMVRALIEDVSVRKFIDLDSPSLPAGLQMLVTAGFTVDVDKIINDPIQDGERV